ncbi:MarR family transcriptional regulator [Altericroceibacterium spongiae]|uniref:MarR family transcriptional regulator n=1 Tax=Altericroceibacterium spongiae TaxID=2320269 RepID=A0A420EC26_9SPHN|nr:MarR family transcriptional regulator [Altericroceibacterium spongiae]RKF18226.1 MarR family transcriptional regulator [Altericroceibacterium spongiae]
MNAAFDVLDYESGLQLDQQMCFPIYASANAIVKSYRPLLEPLGLTYPQYLVMMVLWEKTPISVGDIGRRLLLDSGTLTPLLKRLASAGIVCRRRDPVDERRVLIELTDKGRELEDLAQDIPSSLFAKSKLTDEDRGELYEAIKILRRILLKQMD